MSHSLQKRLNDLSIDKYNLDEEWSDQARRRYIYHEKIATAIEVRDLIKVDQEEAKNNYKRVLSDLIIRIKSNPNTFGLDHATDAMAEARALIHEEYAEAYDHYIECSRRLAILNRQVGRLYGMLESFIDRRKALDNLISLYLNNYFSNNPKIKEMADRILSENASSEFAEKLIEEDPELVEKLMRKRNGMDQ